MSILRAVGRGLLNLLAPMWIPLRALAVSLLGVYLATGWYGGDYRRPATTLLVILAMVYVIDAVGRAGVGWWPMFGLALMEVWVVAPLCIAVFASAAAVVAAVSFTPAEGATPQTKELLNAVGSGITSFLSAAFVAWAADRDDGSVTV